MLFFINDFKNDTEYLYAFSLAFFVGIRMVTQTITLKTSFILSCIYMFILIIMYCLNQRRRIFFTILILFHLYSACIYLTSNFVFILIILLIFVPLFLTKNDNKLNCSILSIFLPLFIIITIQIYGFKNIVKYLISVNVLIKNYFNFDIFSFAQNMVHGEYINEAEMIKNIMNFLIKTI